ncbi:MAG: iron ABC transporter permease [Actinomycetota bacterium]|nr:iron ABC transporter permease [Actinomycetota bacterium]
MAEPAGLFLAGPFGRWGRLGRGLAVGFLVLLVGLPLFELFSAGLEQSREALARAGTGAALRNTLWTGVVVAILALAAGTAAAMATERGRVPGRRWLRVGMLLPLLVPPFVSALSWTRAYGPGGLGDDLLGLAVPGLFGPAGVVAVIAVHAMPLAYLLVASGLAAAAEPDLERAARASGATSLGALRSVTLPLLHPALLGAAALVFVATINAFGIPAILGIPAGFVTVTTRIYQDLAFAADPVSFARVVLLASTLVLIALAVVGAADALVGLAAGATRTGAPTGPTAASRKAGWGASIGLWAYLTLGTGLPLLALVLASVTQAPGLPPVPPNWTLDNFSEALSGRFGGAAARSLFLSVTAASLVVLLGGLLVSLGRKSFGRTLGTLALLTFAVPGSALAVAVLLAYGSRLRDTLLLILIAYLAKFWALGHRTISGSADALPPDLYRAARASGAGPLVALRTVVIPQLRPALAAAWVLVFLFAFHELTMSSLLYGPGTDTLAVVILNLQQLGDVTVTSALAVLLTVPVLAGALLLLAARRPSTRVMGME